MPTLAPGATIDRFRLDRHLGSGGMGAVWSACDERERTTVALKVLHPHLAQRAESRERLLREARASVVVRHPAIVAGREVVEAGGTLLLVMELLEGETLRDRLSREGRLPVGTVAAVLADVASALRAAHAAGVVHRDLKPENVFVQRLRDGQDVVRVLDFGVAKILESSDATAAPLTALGALLGTVAYMAPEQITGSGRVDDRADVWALGVVLYEALVGFRPIEGESQRDLVRRILTEAVTPIGTLVPDVPRDVAELVRRMLSRSSERRPSIAFVAETLERFRG